MQAVAGDAVHMERLQIEQRNFCVGSRLRDALSAQPSEERLIIAYIFQQRGRRKIGELVIDELADEPGHGRQLQIELLTVAPFLNAHEVTFFR
ncbi:hypothetical protein D3C71_1301790 [compost metagenome]